jgi:uncharacterized protein YcaQ
MRLTQTAAQHLLIAAQGLNTLPERETTPADVVAAIQRMAVLQIDTINIVARSPYLVLWSRLGDYDPRWLDDALASRQIFEYWSHEASFLPIEDYPLYRRHQLSGVRKRWWGRARDWLASHAEVTERVMAKLREGEVRSSDFQRTDGQTGSWWNWKEEKVALEMLFMVGDIMVARRHNFQRVYDLRERVVPHWDDQHTPELPEVERTLALKAVRALGVAPVDWIPDYFRTAKTGMNRLIESLADEGALMRVEVEGWRGMGYLHPDNLELARQAAAGELAPTTTTLLSPFDPIVWDRKRAAALFNFDYRIECYTPAPKRVYGYFTLPILRRGQLIGRLDPKAHRKEGIFEVKALHLEPGVEVTPALIEDVADALRRLVPAGNSPQVVVRMSNPPEAAVKLNDVLGTTVS